MWYYRRLADGVVVMQTRPEHAEQLEQLQRDCFPTLDDAQRFKAAHYRKHIELFPDGQFVALDGDKVVGATTTLRLHVRLRPHRPHVRRHHPGRLADARTIPTATGCTAPTSASIPAYRGRGIAAALYAARQEAVWRLGLKGQVTAGMISGYGAVKDRMSGRAST